MDCASQQRIELVDKEQTCRTKPPLPRASSPFPFRLQRGNLIRGLSCVQISWFLVRREAVQLVSPERNGAIARRRLFFPTSQTLSVTETPAHGLDPTLQISDVLVNRGNPTHSSHWLYGMSGWWLTWWSGSGWGPGPKASVVVLGETHVTEVEGRGLEVQID